MRCYQFNQKILEREKKPTYFGCFSTIQHKKKKNRNEQKWENYQKIRKDWKEMVKNQREKEEIIVCFF